MKDKKAEVTGILLMTISFFILLSLVSYNPTEEPTISPNIAITNKMGIIGVYTSHILIKMTIGYVSYIFPLLGVLWGWWVFRRRSGRELARLTLFTLALALIVSVAIGLPPVIRGTTGIGSYQYAGLVGGVLAKMSHDFLGPVGTVLLLLAGALVVGGGYFDLNIHRPVEKGVSLWSEFREKRRMGSLVRKKEEEKREHTEQLLSQLQKEGEGEVSQHAAVVDTESEVKDLRETELAVAEGAYDDEAGEYRIDEEVIEEEIDRETGAEKPVLRTYQLPAVDLLDRHEDLSPSASHEELVEKANFLVQSLRTFGVEGKVVNISPGPIITLFEVEPAEGVRVQKFVQLSDDLARVMKAQRVRVVAPIPGKSSVGIEIPNQNPSIVYLRSVINSEKFVGSEYSLPVALGKTTSGENFVIGLEEMPHLLIAGTTGSGKSVCINTFITSLLFRRTPEEVRFLLIDPKKLELSAYRPLQKYHLITSEDIDEFVITTPDNAVLALRAIDQEMTRRYDVLADSTVRNIQEYREKAGRSKNMEPMPFIVVIIDELADLMLRAAKDVEAPIARLAQLARAVGIHLVLATQRPSVDVITGVIKANFPARIAFQVATRVDSRTIIDSNGAEKLLGNGDLLFLPPASSQAIRLHSSFVSLEEINRLVGFVTQQPTSEEMKLQGSKVQLSAELGVFGEGASDDELMEESVRLVITHQQGSISLLQRRLRIGYARAARLIDQMEQLGIVGPFTGSKAREVLVDESYLQALGGDDL